MPGTHNLVLVPGLLCDDLLWRPQVSALADGARCWTADPTRPSTYGRGRGLTPLDRHEEIAAAIPGSKLEIIEDRSRLSTLERADQVSSALSRWLTEGPWVRGVE